MLVNSYTAINFSKCNIYSDYIFLKGKKIKNKLFFKNFVYSLDKTICLEQCEFQSLSDSDSKTSVELYPEFT